MCKGNFPVGGVLTQKLYTDINLRAGCLLIQHQKRCLPGNQLPPAFCNFTRDVAKCQDTIPQASLRA